jgi:glycosyltransferase involved in cell wall biosynthesis
MKVVIVRSRVIDPQIFKIANTLANYGHIVHLVVWDRQNNLPKEVERRYQVHKFTLHAPYDKGIVSLLLPFWWLFELYTLLKIQGDIIHACDLDTLYPAILVKSIKRTPIFYSIYDFYAFHLPYNPVFLNIFRRLIAFIEKIGISFSDWLFLVDPARFEQVKDAKIKGIEFIYNTPPDRYNTSPSSSTQVPDHKDEMIIFYAGLIRRTRGLEYIIRAVNQIDNVKLVLAGKIEEPYFSKLIRENQNKIEFLDWISYEEVLHRSMSADIIFRFYDPSLPHAKYESPNKLFEAMMCAKPIIVNSGQAAARIVSETKCGIVVKYGDVEELKKAIIAIKNAPSLREKMGLNGRITYEKMYNWQIMEEKLLNIYNLYQKKIRI